MSDGEFGKGTGTGVGAGSGSAGEGLGADLLGPGATPSPEIAGSVKPPSLRDRIIDSTMALAAEREWSDFTVSDVAQRAGISLADFRDNFPSKGAVLGALSKRIDRIVLEGTDSNLVDEPAKERLFDVLTRRLDAMAPYRRGLESVADWARRDVLAAAALNQVAVNSMRFMLEAAGIDTERGAGAVKIQGLVFAWARILDTWLKDEDPGIAKTLAVVDRELERGETLAARADDLDRILSPLRLVARRLLSGSRRDGTRTTRDRTDPDGIGAGGIA